jgi:hypothetical protein
MKIIHRAETPAEAHLAVGILGSHGIYAQVTDELLHGARGEAPMDMSTLPGVAVAEEDAERAVAILKESLEEARTRSTSGEPWKCPGCGEDLDATFTECWSCGASRPESGEA